MARSRGFDTQTLLLVAGLGALVYFLMSGKSQAKGPGGPPPSQPYMPPVDFGLNNPTTWDETGGGGSGPGGVPSRRACAHDEGRDRDDDDG